MTSKNSFLVSLKENSKRRLWVWVVSAIGYMLIFPVALSMFLSNIAHRSSNLIEKFGAAAAEEILHERLIESVITQTGFSGVRIAFTAVLALVCGVQGFSWLYSRKKIDFYMGVPVKRSKRFLIIWQNGVLIYLLPRLLGVVIELLIAAGAGAVDRRVLISAAAAFGVDLCFYLSVYHMALLAVMLTGNIVITGCGFFVFCVYEWIIRDVLNSYRGLFFRYYYFGSEESPLISPFTMYYELAATFNFRNRLDVGYLAGMLAFAAAVGALAYLCYRKRPAEAAGKAMTFAVTRPVIKILLVIPFSLLAGLLIASVVDFEPKQSTDGIGYVIFGIGLVLVLGSALIQAIYEFDIKGALHRKLHIVISGLLTALIFLVFHFDLLGFDEYVPDPNQVESVAFVPQGYDETTGNVRFDEEGNYISEQTYAEKYMYLTNAEDVCRLAQKSIKDYNALMEAGMLNEDMIFDGEVSGKWSSSRILYRLKSGRKVFRQIWVNVEDQETGELLDRIIGSDEFKEGYMIGASDHLINLVNDQGSRKIAAAYGNMVYWNSMSSADAVEFLRLYQKDLAEANFSRIRENVPVGLFSISIAEEIPAGGYTGRGGYATGTRTWESAVNIYPFYEECISWLKEKGYFMDTQLALKDIDHIQIVNDNLEANEKLQKEKQQGGIQEAEDPTAEYWPGMVYTADEYIDTKVYAEYTDEQQLKEIIDSIYPFEMLSGRWDYGAERDDNIGIFVYFKTDSPMTRSYGTNASYSFLKGQVPDFVIEDTAYREK